MRPALAVFDRTGVPVWSRDDIALLREEVLGRLEVTNHLGEVGHCPGPLSSKAGVPLLEVQPGIWVNPRHVREDGSLPGGWAVEGCSGLAPPASATDPLMEGTPARLSQVLWVEPGDRRSEIVTDLGRFPGPPTSLLTRRYPALVRAGSICVNVLRIERLDRSGTAWQIRLRGGPTLQLGRSGFSAFCRAMGSGVGHPAGGVGGLAALYRTGLRDWPQPFLYWESEALQARFHDPVELLAQVIWQVKRTRDQGRDDFYGRDIRALYYRPVEPVMLRAGFRDEDVRALLEDDLAAAPEGLYRLMEQVLARMVGDWRLLTYADLHFRDARADLRRIGTARPEVLLAAEKTSVQEDAFTVAELFGVSAVVLGGSPSLLGTEMLARALGPAIRGRVVTLVTFVDFDLGGWGVWKGLVSQLERYGIEVRLLGHLVRPSRFTEWELENLAFPIEAHDPRRRAKAQKWLEETGGIGGRLLGMHSDHLRPFERVVAAFREETGLEPV